MALYNVAPSFYGIFNDKATFGYDIPKEFVFRHIGKSSHFKNCGIGGTIFYAEKCEKNTLIDRIKIKMVLIKIIVLYRIYALYLLLIKLPSPIKNFLKIKIINKFF